MTCLAPLPIAWTSTWSTSRDARLERPLKAKKVKIVGNFLYLLADTATRSWVASGAECKDNAPAFSCVLITLAIYGGT